jgi:pyruvate/2-oxoglutarate dehydrogenase complex dihydrolipoamide dehydrogenase (E3) component
MPVADWSTSSPMLTVTSVVVPFIVVVAFSSKIAAMASTKEVTKKVYDMIVIGGGSAGLTAAKLGGGTLKKNVLLIEGGKLGGDCTWTGCVPSKSLLAKAKAAKIARSKILQTPSGSPVDWNHVKEYYTRNQQEIFEEDDSAEALSKFDVVTLHGMATLTSSTTVTVVVPNSDENSSGDDTSSSSIELMADQGIILCTGATPNRPDSSAIAGLDDIEYLTYEEIWELENLPKRLTVVGGGPIGECGSYEKGRNTKGNESRPCSDLVLSPLLLLLANRM